ncbi:MAG: hypothetical protein HON65_03165 [Rhodospirillales bacterium]|jgi:PPOX class probable F420-dependent enzyme|nr:hypothetical protein [Rhodospirillales bacterium]
MAHDFKEMTQDQVDAFLHDVRNLVIGTNRRDGAPLLSLVWYFYENGLIYIGIDGSSAKYHNIKRDPRVTVCFDGGNDDSRNITIYGRAEFIEIEDPDFDRISWQIHLRYCESEEAARVLHEDVSKEPDRALLVITPEKTLALDYN